jgi:hypothetical protein
MVTVTLTLQRLRATDAADFRDGTLTAKDCAPSRGRPLVSRRRSRKAPPAP